MQRSTRHTCMVDMCVVLKASGAQSVRDITVMMGTTLTQRQRSVLLTFSPLLVIHHSQAWTLQVPLQLAFGQSSLLLLAALCSSSLKTGAHFFSPVETRVTKLLFSFPFLLPKQFTQGFHKKSEGWDLILVNAGVIQYNQNRVGTKRFEVTTLQTAKKACPNYLQTANCRKNLLVLWMTRHG